MNKKNRTYDIVTISLFTVLIAVCSWISIPFTIPFTMQTFAVFSVLLLLGGKKGIISIILYFLLGLIGIPVFANFSSGFGTLFGPTGGYIIGFILIGLSYLLLAPFTGKILSLIIGLICCYLFGTIWFVFIYQKTITISAFVSGLSVCVLPYIIPDTIKLLLAYFINKRLINYSKEKMRGDKDEKNRL